MKHPLIVLHGWTYTHQRWEPLIGMLRQAGLKPRLLDIPGLTGSLNKPWSLEDYIDWLHGQISQTGRPVVLVGHSNGGRIALAFTVRYPELVHKLILIDSAGIYHRELGLRIKRFVFRGLAKVGKFFTASPRARSWLYRIARVSDYHQAPPHMRQTMINLIAHDLTRVLPDIAVPTLIIWGQGDTTTPLADALTMKTQIPGAHLEIITGAKHSPHITHSHEVSRFITKFLK
ncbi:MAG: alpha/beta hydrolase [Patescibacteria group bacterium]|nr:alpha/beta hydrolase [Patescibacteria group bacterium]